MHARERRAVPARRSRPPGQSHRASARDAAVAPGGPAGDPDVHGVPFLGPAIALHAARGLGQARARAGVLRHRHGPGQVAGEKRRALHAGARAPRAALAPVPQRPVRLGGGLPQVRRRGHVPESRGRVPRSVRAELPGAPGGHDPGRRARPVQRALPRGVRLRRPGHRAQGALRARARRRRRRQKLGLGHGRALRRRDQGVAGDGDAREPRGVANARQAQELARRRAAGRRDQARVATRARRRDGTVV